jgi:hypothetical protein
MDSSSSIAAAAGITMMVNPFGPSPDRLLHTWDWGLQLDINAIFGHLQRVQFPIAATPY